MHVLIELADGKTCPPMKWCWRGLRSRGILQALDRRGFAAERVFDRAAPMDDRPVDIGQPVSEEAAGTDGIGGDRGIVVEKRDEDAVGARREDAARLLLILIA
jgi:hypothetical protein